MESHHRLLPTGEFESDRSNPPINTRKPRSIFCAVMAGIRGKFGPPGNQNAFRHGLVGIAQRRADGDLGITAPISIYDRAQSGRFACSTEADLGEPLVILGYPSYGSDAGTFVSIFSSLDVTATEGIMAGKDEGFYTTSAKIEHGNSGGLAIDEKNDCYLGIPTAPYTGQIESLGRILPASYVVK